MSRAAASVRAREGAPRGEEHREASGLTGESHDFGRIGSVVAREVVDDCEKSTPSSGTDAVQRSPRSAPKVVHPTHDHRQPA